MIALAIISALGLFLRLLVLHTQGTGWFDELFSLHFARMPFLDGLRYLLRDVHPPLYDGVLHEWLVIFGPSLTAARALSIVLGTALIPLMAWLCRKAGMSRRVGLVAALLTAVSPVLLFYSADARMYPMLLVAVAGATITFLSLLERPTARALRVWALTALLMLFVHVTAVVPFAIMVAWGAWRLPRRQKRSFFAYAVAAFAPFAAWAAYSFIPRLARLGTEWQFTGSGVPAPFSVFASFFAYDVTAWMLPLIAVAFLIIAARALFAVRREGRDWRVVPSREPVRWFLFVCALAPFLVALPFGTATVKYFFVAYPAATVLVAAGADALLPSSRRTAVIAALAVFAAVLIVPVATLSLQRRIRWDDAFKFVETHEHSGDLLYLSWFGSELPAREYYHGTLPRIAAYPYDKSLSFDERLVRYAGEVRTTQQTLDELASAASYAPRVFVVGGKEDAVNDPVQHWFATHGWTLVDSYSSTDLSPTVLLYRRTSY